MCEFKPGDLVVCVSATGAAELTERAEYIIDRVIAPGDVGTDKEGEWEATSFAVMLVGVAIPGWDEPDCDYCGFDPIRFRKVERKSDSLSIEAFRTIKDGCFEEPRRTNQPAKRKEQA